MSFVRAAVFAVVAGLCAAPAAAQESAYPGFGPDYDTGDLAPGFELPGQFPDTPEREQVTPFGEEPSANDGEQDRPINVIGGQTETFEPGLIGDALNTAKSRLLDSARRDAQSPE